MVRQPLDVQYELPYIVVSRTSPLPNDASCILPLQVARAWFQEQHMFQKTESLLNSLGGIATPLYTKLRQELFQIVSGETPPKDNGPAAAYGHPHYTIRFDSLLLEQLAASASVTTAEHADGILSDKSVAADANITAVLNDITNRKARKIIKY